MRILYWPQLSMRSYVDSSWVFMSDAQVTKMRAYIDALPVEWDWTWLGPPLEQRTGSAIVLPPNVKFREFPWMDNVLEGRYFFPMREFMRVITMAALGDVPYDVILLEVPELARNVRVAVRYTELVEHLPIVSMVEHVDIYDQTRVPEMQSFMLRQIDGALASDVLAFPLRGMWLEWTKALGATVHPDVQARVQERCRTWNAIYSPREVQEAEAHRMDTPRPVINFISRLSDNQRTHYEEFFAAVRLLEKDDSVPAFDVWVANPNQAMETADIFELAESVTKVGNNGRGDYLDMLWQSDIVPILYPQDLIYSLGFCEAITAGNMVLTTNFEGWPGWKLEPGYDGDPAKIAEGLRMMLSASTADGAEVLHRQEKWLAEDRSVEANIAVVQATIESACR